MPVTIRITEEGGSAVERAIADLEKSLENLQRAQNHVERSSTRAARALDEGLSASESAEQATERYGKALERTSRESQQATRAIQEAEVATKRLRDETAQAGRAEEGRSSSMSHTALVIAKLAGVHLLLHGALVASKKEGGAVNAAFGAVRRGVTAMSVATLGATSALSRLRDMKTEVGQRAGAALVPLQRFSTWLGSAQRLTLGLAGAGGLLLLSRALIRVGEAAGDIVPVRRAFDQLSGSIGSTGDALRMDLQDAVAGTVSETQLMKTAVLALNSSAIDSREDLLELAASARVLGRTTGVSTADGIDRMVRAIGLVNPVQLKALGITLSVTDAYRAYAAQLGVSTADLDDHQRKEAFRIAVLAKTRTAVLNVADAENLRSTRLDALRRNLATLDPLGREFEATTRAISIEVSRLAAGTDDLNTRLQRMRATFKNQGDQIKVLVSENKQLVGLVGDVEQMMGHGSLASRALAASISAVTTAVTGLTRLAIGPLGQVLALLLGWRAIPRIFALVAPLLTKVAAGLGVLGGRALLLRLGALFGPAGIIITGGMLAVGMFQRMNAAATESAAAMREQFTELQEVVEALSYEAALREVERVKNELDDATATVADLQEKVELERRQARQRGGVVGELTRDGTTGRELDAAEANMRGLQDQFDLLRRRFVDLSRQQSQVFGGVARMADVSWDAWRRLNDAQRRGKDNVRDIRDEIIILQQEMLELEAGTEEFDKATEALAKLTERLDGAQRSLRAIGQLAEGVGRQLLQAFEPVDPSGLSVAATSVIFREPRGPLSQQERARASRDRLMQPLTGGSKTGREARVEAEIASVTAALQSMAVVGGVSESVLAVVRARLAELGVTAEHIDQVLGQFADGSKAKMEQAAASSIAAFGAMGQAAIRGSDQMAQSVINAFTQILQAQAQQSGWGGSFGIPIIGAIGGIISAIAGRSRRDTQPVKVEAFSRDAERSLERAQEKEPQILRVNLIAPGTGEILESMETELHRRAGRDANARPLTLPFRFIGKG